MLKVKRIYPLITILVCLMIPLLLKMSGLMLNITNSMPEGFYIRSQGAANRGDIVSACVPAPYKAVGLERDYLAKGNDCQGVIAVIKQVMAIPGDNVLLTEAFIKVNEIQYPLKTRYVDSLARPLDVYPRGSYNNTQGYWLIGTHDVKSWDSRYWGPVSKEQIISKLKPIFTW